MGSLKTSPPGSIGSRSSRNRQGNNFDLFAAPSVGEGTSTTALDSVASSRRKGALDEEHDELGQILPEGIMDLDLTWVSFDEDTMGKSALSVAWG
jgi:hypothetical protein